MKRTLSLALIGAAALSAFLITPTHAQNAAGAAQPKAKGVKAAKAQPKAKAVKGARIIPAEMAKAMKPEAKEEKATGVASKEGQGQFMAPELLTTAKGDLGGSSLYPSPVLHDIDNDGVNELIVGGLRGYLSIAQPMNGGWSAEAKLKATDGKDLKFNNW